MSMRNGILTGSSVGILKVRMNAMPAYPTTIPPSPPSSARTRLSVRSSRISRKRPAPIASRTAISRVRVRARPRRSPAALVHATSSTASARIVKITPNFQLTSSSCVRISNWVLHRRAAVAIELRILALEARASTASSFRACRSVVPGFRRPSRSAPDRRGPRRSSSAGWSRRPAPSPAACRSRDARRSASPGTIPARRRSR